MNIPIDKIRSKRILVVGDLMLDVYLRGKANRISPEAPVPVVAAECREFIPGGAANVMANLRALGCDVTAVGFLGNDDEGERLLDILESTGVKTESIIFTDELSTIHKTRVLANGQHVVRFDFDSDFSKISEDKRSDLIGYMQTLVNVRHFDAVVVSDYCKGTITSDVMATIKESYSCPIIADTKPQHKSYFHNTWCITPNLDEAKQMIEHRSEDDLFAIARELKEEMSLQSIIITLADKGILLIDEDNNELLYNAYVNVDEHDPTQRFDVTGAGDTVISVFSACVAAGLKTSEAVYAANIAAGIVVSKIGTASCSYDELFHELGKKKVDEGNTA